MLTDNLDIPAEIEIPDDVFAYCYDEPQLKADFLGQINQNMVAYIKKSKLKMENSVGYVNAIRWMYERSSFLMRNLIEQRRGHLEVEKSNPEKEIRDLEEVGAIITAISSLAIEDRLLSE